MDYCFTSTCAPDWGEILQTIPLLILSAKICAAICGNLREKLPDQQQIQSAGEVPADLRRCLRRLTLISMHDVNDNNKLPYAHPLRRKGKLTFTLIRSSAKICGELLLDLKLLSTLEILPQRTLRIRSERDWKHYRKCKPRNRQIKFVDKLNNSCELIVSLRSLRILSVRRG